MVWSPCSPRDSQESSSAPWFKSISSLMLSFLYGPTLTSIHTTGKTIALTRQIFVGKVMSLLFNAVQVAHSFSSKEQESFNFMAGITMCSDFLPPPNKVCHCFHCFPIYLPWSDGTRCHDLSFWMLSFKPNFPLSSFTFIKRLFSSSSLSAVRVVSSAYLRLLVFPGNLDFSLCFIQPSVSHDVLCI